MKLVNVARLREKLSYYLNLVKKGEELVVTSHRRRVARLIPASAPSGEITEPTRPVEDLHNIKGVKLKRSVSAVRLLLSDRRADEDRR
jgi:prevent-host-death family protein